MSIPDSSKDPSITHVLQELTALFEPGAFVIVDHWDADLCAIGIAQPHNHQVLVYISTYRQPNHAYAVDLELPSDTDDDVPYQAVAQYDLVDFPTLATLVGTHLGITPRQGRV